MKPATLCKILPLSLKIFSTTLLLLLLCGCNIFNNNIVSKLTTENVILKSKNNSLARIINTLRVLPEDILRDVNSLIALNEQDNALVLLNMLKSRLPDQKQLLL